ncbi:hypothetical protein [Bacillus sp. FJAT-45037]|uniref:hypothetical protein n=1 Tax=Bacillus sp. FJAT-45037 TaxID=2011007 RepID=UPI000C2428D1|nr:hypothetical protein [Bacillus sp. FJAT-45037]
MKTTGGILLVVIGGSVLLSMIGIHIGGLISLALGGWLMYVGYGIWERKGVRFSSGALFSLGAIIFFGGIGGVVSLLISIFLIAAGYKLLAKNRNETNDLDDDDHYTDRFSSIDEEFKRLVRNK